MRQLRVETEGFFEHFEKRVETQMSFLVPYSITIKRINDANNRLLLIPQLGAKSPPNLRQKKFPVELISKGFEKQRREKPNHSKETV